MAINTVIAKQAWYNVRKGQSQVTEKQMPCLHGDMFFQSFDERSDRGKPKVFRGCPWTVVFSVI